MSMFRLQLKPASTSLKATIDHCIKEGLLGVGWAVNIENTKVWDDYHKKAKEIGADWRTPYYIKQRIKINDLIWTRDTHGQYYLAKATSGWEYYTTKESNEQGIDISNVFRCIIHKVNHEDVPGKIIACFRARRTIQAINSKNAEDYTKGLWNKLNGTVDYQTAGLTVKDTFMLFDDEETEDLVFLYLQSRGWYIIPNSRKGDTQAFEYFCVNPKTGEIAGTQVKTGGTPVNQDNYANFSNKTFLFQPYSLYIGTPNSKTIIITKEEIETFIQDSLYWLPACLKRKIAIGNTLIHG